MVSASFAQPGAHGHIHDDDAYFKKTKKTRSRASRSLMKSKRTSNRKEDRVAKGTRQKKHDEGALDKFECVPVEDSREVPSPRQRRNTYITTTQRSETRKKAPAESVTMTSSLLLNAHGSVADRQTLSSSKKHVEHTSLAKRQSKISSFEIEQFNEGNTCDINSIPNHNSVLESIAEDGNTDDTQRQSICKHSDMPDYVSDEVSSYSSSDESMTESIMSASESEASYYSIGSLISEVGHIQTDVKRGFLLMIFNLYPKFILRLKPSLRQFSMKRLPFRK
jgi:hypothetical protein